MKSFYRNFLKYFHTIRYLKRTQIIARLNRFFRSPRLDHSKAPLKRKKSGNWQISARRTRRMIDSKTFCFLNETHQITNKSDWNNSKRSKLWLYNLHYFDDLNAINASNRSSWHFSLIKLWIKDNPPCKGNGWEPYPISLRVVNWIKWDLNDNNLGYEELDSLAIQIRYLKNNLEYHLLGNHLFSNAKTLIFAGLFFDGIEADSWYTIGINIFHEEINEQILSDGGNFELSTMYHCLVFEDLLDIINIHNLYNREISTDVKEIASKMLYWMLSMCHPDGEISFFNDAAFNIAPSTNQLLEYAKNLGFKEPITETGLTDFKESGYSRVSLEDMVAIIDRAKVGPDYIPGHAHADTLSFELSIYGCRVIVNSGTSIYGISKERLRQRGTAAHATAMINNQNSSEVWSGFRVARRARVFDIESSINNIIYLSASHDGYRRLLGKPIHKREWCFSANELEVIDTFLGKGTQKIDINFPIHPKVNFITTDINRIVLGIAGKDVTFLFEGSGETNILDSTYHPEFGVSIKCKKIVNQVTGMLPIKIKTRIIW